MFNFSRLLKCLSSKQSHPSSSSSSTPAASASVISEPPPLEVVSEILIRLPVTDLLRYKTVSKAWNDLISSPYFIKQHLNKTLTESGPGPKTRSVQTDHFLILTSPQSLQILTFSTLIRTLKLDFSSEFTPPDSSSAAATTLIGTCHGLVCVCGNQTRDIAIYNPSTRANRVIASAPTVHPPLSLLSLSFGFGYDAIGDDYKVVRIENYILRRREQKLESYTRDVIVYSLRSDSWKTVSQGESPDDHIDASRGVLVNDRLHWVAVERKDGRKGKILSFDLSEDKFGQVPIPPHYGEMVHYPKEAATVGGKLCFMTEANSRGPVQYIDVWIMDQYGQDRTWYMLYSMWCLRYPTPVVFLRDEDLVLVNEGGCVSWYLRKDHKKSDFKIAGVDDFDEATLCLPSLVPVHY